MNVVSKVVRVGLKIWLLATIVFAVFYWRLIHQVVTYNTVLLPPMYGEPADQTEARAQDLRYLRKLLKIDRSFSEDARADFSEFVDELDTRVETLSDADFYLAVGKAAALADNGHTNVSDQPLYRQFNTIGARLYWFADGLFVVRADAAHSDTVGKRIIAVEGQPLANVVSTLSQYRGGNAQYRQLVMPMMIESPEILHAAGLASSPDTISIMLETSTGELNTVSFEGERVENGNTLPRRYPWMMLKPEALPGENAGWTRALNDSGGAVLLYLRDIDMPIYAPLPGNGHYIRTQSGFGSAEQPVQAFFEKALSDIDDASLDYLVVDYRWNRGGDFTRSVAFAKSAPNKVKDGGRLYLAVGPQTFSASIVTVAMLKFYAGDKAVIIGAPMGDREQFWAETGMSFSLPNSGYYVNYATGYHDWNQGCEGHPYCFTQNLIHQVPAGSLTPTIAVEPTFADYASGRDVLMDRIRTDQASLN